MRLVTFRDGTEERLGFLLDDHVVDPKRMPDHAGEAAYGDAIAFIRAGEPALQAARRLIDKAPASARVPLSKITLTAPMRPSTLLCSGSNYRDHNKEKANTPISGKEPEFFVKTADSVVGPGEPIIYDPALTKKLDCETELAIVIGKPGRHIPAASALDHVFGYTIVNDVTARDRQVRRSPEGSVWYDLGRGKSFDTSAPLGPCIVTADEIADPQKLKLETRINGDLRQSSSNGRNDLDLRGAHPFLLVELHAAAGHGHHHRHARRHRMVDGPRARRQVAGAAGPGARQPLLPAGRPDRIHHRAHRRAAQRGGARLGHGCRRSRPAAGPLRRRGGSICGGERRGLRWIEAAEIGHRAPGEKTLPAPRGQKGQVDDRSG